MGLSANALAVALHVPASRIDDIVLERRGVTVDTAQRLVGANGADVFQRKCPKCGGGREGIPF